MANCEAIFKLNGNGNTVSISISEEEKNDLNAIIAKLFDNENKKLELIQLQSQQGFIVTPFQIGLESQKDTVGNESFVTLINKYLHPSLINKLSELGIRVDDNTILVKQNISGIGNTIQNDDGVLKFIIKEENIQSALNNIIKLTIAHKTIMNNNQEDEHFITDIQKIYDDLKKSMSNDKIKKSERLIKAFKYLEGIENQNERLAEFLVYCYGDRKFKESLEKIKIKGNSIFNLISEKINDYTNVQEPETIVKSGKLSSLISERNKVQKEALKKDLKNQNAQDSEIYEYLTGLINDFNNQSTNQFIDILYDGGEYYALRIVKEKPILNDGIEVFGARYYGASAKVVDTYYGYNIVRTQYGRYIIDDHILSHSYELISKRRVPFGSISEAKEKIDSWLNCIKNLKTGQYIGSYIKPFDWRHDLHFTEDGTITIPKSYVEKVHQFNEDDIIRTYSIPDGNREYTFTSTHETLNKRIGKIKKGERISFNSLTKNIEHFCDDNGFPNFFENDKQRQRYQKIITDYEKLELFLLIAHDKLLHELGNDSKNDNITLFNVDNPELRYQIIQETLNILEESKRVHYRVKQVETNEATGEQKIIVERIQETPSYKIPRINIKRDLIKVVDHLKRHYGVECNIINNYDIVNGFEQGGKKIKLPKSCRDAKAFIFKGQIFINIDKAQIDDVVHEYAHLYLGIIKQNNPQLYLAIINTTEKLPDFQKQLEYERKRQGERSEIDLKEEIFVRLLGQYFGNRLTLGYHTDEGFEIIVNEFKETYQECIEQTFGLSDRAKDKDFTTLNTMTIEQIFEAFGSVIMSDEYGEEDLENKESKKELSLGQKIVISRKVSNVISKLLAATDKDKIRIEEICE